MKGLRKYLILVPIALSLLISIAVVILRPVDLIRTYANKGNLNATDLKEGTVYELLGEWQYFDGLLINEIDEDKVKEYRTIPHFFEKKKELGNNPYGVASYELKVSGLTPEIVYGIQVLDLRTAYNLNINGVKILNSGVVGYTKEEHEPQWGEKVGFFKPDSNGNAEIIVEISNFSYNEGGFRKVITLGEAKSISNYSSYQKRLEIFLFSVSFVIGMYFLGVYLSIKPFSALLPFAMLCIINAFRIIIRGHRIIYNIFNNFPWDIAVRLEFLFGYILLPITGLLIYHMGYVNKRKEIKFIYYFFILISIILSLFTPNEIYANLLLPYINLIKISLLYFIPVIIIGIFKKRRDAILIMFICLTGIASGIYDYQVNGTIAALPIATYVFIILISIMLTDMIRQSYKKLEEVSKQLSKSLETEKELTEKLTEMNMAKDDFIAITSHEMKTPLSGIISLSESLINDDTGLLSKEQVDNIKLVANSSKKLSSIVNDLLDIVRFRYKDLKVNLENHNLNKIVHPVLQVLISLNDKNIRIINNINKEHFVFVDENRLEQILYNLVGNSIKFTNNGYIKLSSEIYNEKVCIIVEDTGSGIPEKMLSKIWLPYEQLKNSIGEYSMGLGLTISKYLVELMNGEIWVESKEGVGSKFFFTLAMGKVDDVALNVATDEETESIEEYNNLNIVQTGSKILVVDDEYILRKAIFQYLKNKGYIVITAATGYDALSIVEKNRDISLVILDLMMPDISGFDVCIKIRETFTLNEMPILILTASGKEENFILGFKSGANDFLVKPFMVEELLLRVKTLVAMKLNYEMAINNELAFLQAQIKPHFIQNVLSTISYSLKNPEKAKKLIYNLSIYLRNNFDFYNLDKFIPLIKELETIDVYIEIEKERYGNRLQYIFNMDNNIDVHTKIPPLIIQPLVENAVNHGVMKNIEGGKIELYINKVDNGIKFLITDNGPGISEDKIQDILTGKTKGSIALKNINTRLNRIYGVSLNIVSNENTQISFIIKEESN